MEREYQALPIRELGEGAGYRRPTQPLRRVMVRGIFSLSQMARQLGVTLQSSGEVARTFSDIEAALGR